MDPLTHYRGYSADFEVTFRDEDGAPVAGAYSGAEDLSLSISGDCVEVDLTDSTVAWLVPATPTATLHLDYLDVGALPAGRYVLEIAMLDAYGDPVCVYRNALLVKGC